MKMKILKEVDEKQLTLIPKNKGLEVTESRKEQKQTNKHTYTHKYMIQIPSMLKAILLIERTHSTKQKGNRYFLCFNSFCIELSIEEALLD